MHANPIATHRRPPRSWERRAFVKLGTMALAAATVPGPARASGGPARVVVIGAGLGGLSAAFELAELGHDVTVLEAQPRNGGRVLTLRAPFADGLYADAGAARISLAHDLTLRYARRFDLRLVPFYPADGRYLDLQAGRRREVGWNKFSDMLRDSFGLQMGRPDA